MNEEIREKEIRVIGADGSALGVISTRDAQRLAEEADMDLVMMSPMQSHQFVELWTLVSIYMSKQKKKKMLRKNKKL